MPQGTHDALSVCVDACTLCQFQRTPAADGLNQGSIGYHCMMKCCSSSPLEPAEQC